MKYRYARWAVMGLTTSTLAVEGSRFEKGGEYVIHDVLYVGY